ncbi:MAG: putative nucleotidyltransferase with HDIG domain [Candidatus Paceibacteria bacterium]|jgi:putative nucleotidyltransferase with HDIG domain
MSTQRAKELIRDNLTIPTLPAVVQRISQMIEDPEMGTAEIGAAVGEDAPLAAKVLRIANSSYYGLRERCLSTDQAAGVLGGRVLKNVVTQAAVIQQFEHLAGTPDFDIDKIWRHASLTAAACQTIARACEGKIGLAPEEFHVCGLLHDIGKVVMVDSLGQKYLDIFSMAASLGEPLYVVELRELGFNHTDVGAIIANHWSLPPAVSSAIQFHHGPREAVRDDPIVALVANANLVCHRVENGEIEAAEATLDESTMEFLGIAPRKVPAIVAAIVDFQSESML